jgi:hypothetical protein
MGNSLQTPLFALDRSIAALLMSSLAPTVSQAVSLAQNGQGISIEVCTTTGIKMTQVIDAR